MIDGIFILNQKTSSMKNNFNGQIIKFMEPDSLQVYDIILI